jgi:hypothetical protein
VDSSFVTSGPDFCSTSQDTLSGCLDCCANLGWGIFGTGVTLTGGIATGVGISTAGNPLAVGAVLVVGIVISGVAAYAAWSACSEGCEAAFEPSGAGRPSHERDEYDDPGNFPAVD